MDDHQNEAQLMSARSDHGTFVLLKSYQSYIYILTGKKRDVKNIFHFKFGGP